MLQSNKSISTDSTAIIYVKILLITNKVMSNNIHTNFPDIRSNRSMKQRFETPKKLLIDSI